ncbi:hypothetical protein [Catenulispora subtropica]|uniref:Tat pathway signal sequence domain protein n=1 Tax=Catenulispora subtropica TaxID=450798 RepID=A0ABN2RJT9_9ACTN
MTFRLSRRDSAVALSGLLAGAAVAAAVAAAAWPSTAATTAAKAAPATSAPTAVSSSASLAPDPVNVTLRNKEIVLPSQSPYTSGKLALVPLRLTCGLATITGTHADEQAAGQYCRIRVALTGTDAFTHTFDVAKTALTTTAGTSIGYSYEAQDVKRQPDKIAPVGSHDRYEFDIYYDVPRDVTVNGFTFTDGEGGPTVKVPLPVREWPFS